MGTLINAAAVVIASIVGVVFKKGLPENMQKALMFTIGLSIALFSTGWFLQTFLVIDESGNFATEGELLILLSLVIGTLIGTRIDIDGALNRFANHIEKTYRLPPLAKGFVSGTLIFCVGSLAILGAIEDGLTGDYTILLVKSVLDFVTAMLLAAVLGIGVIFSAISILVYQGSIYLLALFAGDVLTTPMIDSVSMVGSIILVAMGLTFMEIKSVKVANMLPALLLPIIYYIIIGLL